MTGLGEGGHEGEGRATSAESRPPGRTSGAPYPPGERHDLGQDRRVPRVPTAKEPDEDEGEDDA